jgi:hypothetical protein
MERPTQVGVPEESRPGIHGGEIGSPPSGELKAELGQEATPVVRWRAGVSDHLGYYVYLLRDPRSRKPFYIGKGTGNRCFAHLDEAHKTQADSSGDYEKLATIRRVEDAGRQVVVEILRHGLDEATAYEVESAAIDLVGIAGLANRVTGKNHSQGRMSVEDIDAAYGARKVTFDPAHHIVLIRINRAYPRVRTARDLYEATRKYWKISPKRKPTHAMAVYDGVIRAVYRISGWTKPRDPKLAHRWGFTGVTDEAMEKRYKFGNVTHLFSTGDQNPVRYINC